VHHQEIYKRTQRELATRAHDTGNDMSEEDEAQIGDLQAARLSAIISALVIVLYHVFY
jgi:hypothetical protein